MKGLKEIIQEKLKIGKTSFMFEKLKINSKSKINEYNYIPKDRLELGELIDKLIKERGNKADLNDIDVSNIKDMSYMFSDLKFNGDISKWDVSNVTDMESMFRNSEFDGDLSKWDVSNVKTMEMMFDGSKFTGKNGDISNWNIYNVVDLSNMFAHSKFSGNLSKWENMRMFDKDMMNTFLDCPLSKNPPKWYNQVH